MFEVLIIICALENGITTNKCIDLTDTWGPYRTEENCQIRLNQMENEIKNNPLIDFYVFSNLGFPEYIVPVVTTCISDNQESA